MKIKTGYLYHIKDIFFERMNDESLMRNHEIGQKRPTYFTIKDDDIYWFIPLSSKVEKYKKIIADKISKNGVCDSIIIAKVFNRESAILLQNAFPTLPKYIDYAHINKGRNSQLPILLQKRILKQFKKMLSLKLEGKNLFFTNIDKLKEKMIKEAQEDKNLLNIKIMTFKVELKSQHNNIWKIIELPSFMTVADLAYTILLTFDFQSNCRFLIYHNGINYKNYNEDSDLLYNNFKYANLTKLEDLNFLKSKNLVMDYDFISPITYKITYIGYEKYPHIKDEIGYGTNNNEKIKNKNNNLQKNFLKIKKEYELVE